jgi:hypothetical protein
MSAKKDIAYHEAGHAIIALDEEIGLGEFVRMSLNDGFCHFAEDIEERAAKKPSLWAPRVIKALLAGQIAQERFVTMEGDRILDGDREAWSEDDRKCREIAMGGLG